MSKSKIFTLGLVAILALTGCSTAASPNGKFYASMNDFKADFIAAGGECDTSVTKDFWRATEGLSCNDGDTRLELFKDHATAVRAGQSISDLCGKMKCEDGTLVGDNWILNTRAPELFQEALGGTILEKK